MKLNVDLSLLLNAVKNMGAEEREFQIELDIKDIESIDIRLHEGLDIQLDDIATENGLLSYEGRQILLYIPEQYNISETLADGSTGKKFHVADCSKLDEMKMKGRFDRYIVTNDLSGSFNVYGRDRASNQNIEGDTELDVCKLCLKYLNYKGYNNPQKKHGVFNAFKIEEFFDTYSSFFKRMPSGVAARAKEGYTDDWDSIATKIKVAAGYQCSNCRVKVSPHNRLLHAHHKNGVKSDNSFSNIIALCADCHRKEPHHDHMFVRHSDSVLINQLRHEQNLIQTDDWSDVYEYADPALHGVIDMLEQARTSIPTVGFEIQNGRSEVVSELELAWESKRIGIAIRNEDLAAASNEGWSVWSMQECLTHAAKLISEIR